MMRAEVRGVDEKFFELKKTKKVNINDLRLKTRFLTYHIVY